MYVLPQKTKVIMAHFISQYSIFYL